MAKTGHVITDDPQSPKKQLVITGFVEKFVDIQPRGIVRLIGYLGNDIQRKLTIIPKKKYVFEITNVTAKNGENIALELSEKQPATQGYILTVKNTKTDKGRYYDNLIIETTSEVKPVFSIRVFGDIRAKSIGP